MRQLRLTETCELYSVQRNVRGDLINTDLGQIACLYRDISLLNRNVNFREEVTIQGIFWFPPDSAVKMGSIVKYNGLLYRMEDITVAKALLTSDNHHFIKCAASLYRAIS